MSESRLSVNITASDTASAQIRGLQTVVKSLEQEVANLTIASQNMGAISAASIQKEITARGEQLAAVRKQILELKSEAAQAGETAAAVQQLTQATVLFGTTLQGINQAFGLTDRSMKSASDSARTLATSLGAAADADGELRQGEVALTTATNESTAALERQATVLRSMSGAQFFGAMERRMGIGQRSLSAESSAAAMSAQLGPAGTGITTVNTQKSIEDMHGINREMLSAKDSAAALERELGAVGTGLTAVSTRGAIDNLHGIGREMLSARDSAAVFARELGAAGTGITTVATRGAIDTMHGIGREMFSAKDSAAAFARELGSIGGAVRTIPASGFNRMVADLAGVRQSYLSAAQSAAVFQREGLTATEVALNVGDKIKNVATAAETGMARGAAGTAIMTRETRHLVAAFDEIARGQRGALFSTIGAATRDAGVGLSAMAVGIGGLVGVMAALSIAKHAEDLGKWATELRASASAVGLSLPQYSALQGAFEAMGLKATEADAALRHLATNLSTALSDPASKAAQAFRNLGISEDELAKNGTNVNNALRMLAEVFVRTQDDANKSANFNEILGRSYERLLPFLQNGAQGIDEFTQKARENGRVINDEQAKALEELGDKVRSVGEAITSGAIPAFLAWKGPIEAVAEGLRGLIGLASQVLTELGHIVSMPIGGIAERLKAASAETKAKGGPSLGEFMSAGMGGALPNTGLFDKIGEFTKWISQTQPVPQRAGAPEPGEFPNVPSTKQLVPALGKGETPGVLDKMRAEMAEAKRIATDGASDTRTAHEAASAAEAAVLQNTLTHAKLNATQRLLVERELNDKLATLRTEQLSNAAVGQAGPLTKMREEAAKAAEIASRGQGNAKAAREAEARAEIEIMQRTLQTARLNALQRSELETELAHKQMSLRNQELSGGGGAAKQATRDFIAEGRLQVAEADGNAQKIAAIYDNMLAGLKSSHEATAAQIAQIERAKVMAVNRARLDEIREGGRAEIAAMRESRLDRELSQMASGKFKFEGQGQQGPSADITRSKEAVQEAEITRNRAAQEIQALTEIAQAAEEGTKTRRDAEAEIVRVTVAAKQQEVALYKEAGNAAVAAANKISEPFTKLFDGIGSHLQAAGSQIIDALLAPQKEVIKRGLTSTTISQQGQQMRQAASQLLNGIVNDFAKSVQQALSHVIANALSGGAANTIGELLSQTFSKVLGSITGSAAGSALGNVAGSAAGSAAGTAALTTAISTSALSTTTGISSAIAASSAATTTAITASTTAIVGAIAEESLSLNINLLALNAKPSVLGTTYSQGGIVPSAAGGMMVGGNGASLAILHAKEMVLPAPISQGIQQMIASGSPGGNGPNHNASLNYSPTINNNSRGRSGTGMSRGEFSQMMSSHSGAMFGEARNLVRSGWRPA